MDNEYENVDFSEEAVRAEEEEVLARAMRERFPCAYSDPAAIPQKLFLASNAWLVWGAQPCGNSALKIPLRAQGRTPFLCRWKNDAELVSGPVAHAYLGIHGGCVYYSRDGDPYMVAGLMVRLSPTLGLTGIDLDHALDAHGEPTAEAAPLLQAMLDAGMYVERSPSGRGLRGFTPAPLPDVYGGRAIKRVLPSGLGVEVYASERLLTVTGQAVPGSRSDLEPNPAAEAVLRELHRIAAPAVRPATKQGPRPAPSPLMVSDQELLDKAFRNSRGGAELRALYDSTAEADHEANRDASLRDLELANMLAWWTGPDTARLDRLMRGSARLSTPERLAKWDSIRVHGITYGESICTTACDGLTSWYRKPGWQPQHQHSSAKTPRRGFHRHRRPRQLEEPEEDSGPVPDAEATPPKSPEEVAVRMAEMKRSILDSAAVPWPGKPPSPPRAVFPRILEAVLDDIAAVFNAGVTGFAFASLLAMLSHGVSARLAIAILRDKPLAGNLFVLLIAASSAGKSDAFDKLFRYFDEADIAGDVAHRAAVMEFRAAMTEWKDLGPAEKKNTPRPEEPEPRRSELYRNLTLEALYDALEENLRPDGTSMVTIRGDEADTVYQQLGAYRPGGPADLSSPVMELWAGGRVKKRRVSSTSVSVGRGYLTVSAATQPAMLSTMFDRRSFLRGFTARHVLISEELPPEPRRFPAGLELLASTWQAIESLTKYLQALEPADEEARRKRGTTQIVHPTPEALHVFASWYDAMSEDLWLQGDERELLIDKVSMNVAKILLLLHVAWSWASGTDPLNAIQASTATRAVRIGAWLIENERRAWDMLLDEPVRQATHPATLALAEAIVAHQADIPPNRIVLNATLRRWAEEAGTPLSDVQLRSRIRPLNLQTATAHAGRGRIIGTADIARLISFVTAAKAPPDADA